MKKVILAGIILLGLVPNIVSAGERNFANLNNDNIKVKGNGSINIQRPNSLKDTIVLVKGLSKSVDLSKFTENQVHQEIVQFFEKLVKQYKFRKYDRPYIAYAALGNGLFGKGFYQLKISKITKLNNRDFGKNDFDVVDLHETKLVPLKVLFSSLKVINPRTLKEDRNATKLIQQYIHQYKFGGSVGILESMVENTWNGVYDKKNSPTGSYNIVKSEKGFDGVINYYIACSGGGIRVITVNKSIGFYAGSNNKRYNNFDSAAQGSCHN